MHNFIYIFLRYLLSAFIFVSICYDLCFAHVDDKRVDFSCSNVDFYDCLKLIEKDLNVSIDITTVDSVDSLVNVDISNATLYDSLKLIFKQLKIKNYYINYDRVNSVCNIKILDNIYNKRDQNLLNLKKNMSSSAIDMDNVSSLMNGDNVTNDTFSSESLQVLEKETQIILEDSDKPDIFIQKDYLERLQAETDKLVQQDKISESNILPEHLEMLYKVDSNAHVETEMSGEDLEVLKTLN